MKNCEHNKKRTQCPQCIKAKQKEWRLKNREKLRINGILYRRNNPQKCSLSSYRQGLKKYGLSLEDYFSLLSKQGGVCAICGKKESKRRLSVDHNHKTGFIRGLLCGYCNNRLLKYLWDNKKRAEGLVSYLGNAVKEDKLWKYNED